MGYILFFQAGRIIHRQEVSKFLSTDKPKNLVSIPVNGSLAEKISLNRLKEIRFKGEMYDIVKVLKSGNSYKLVCYKDTKEDKMIKTSGKHSGNPLNGTQSSRTVRYFLDGMIKTALLDDSQSKLFFSEVLSLYSEKNTDYSGPFLSVPDLPPQIA